MAASDRPPTRVAVVLQGDPTDRRSWSGVPAKLIGGLERAGCEAVPVNALFPGAGKVAHRLGMSWTDQAASRWFAAACGAVASRALRRTAPLDGAIAIGSGYALESEVPTVTFEDMTLAQALRLGDPAYDSLGEAARRRWLGRQKLIYERSRACCVASRWAGESIAADYGVDPSKAPAVGFGRNAEPQTMERDWSVPRFLFVGADWERKRGAAVVAAFAAVRERHPEATLDLVGGHPRVDAAGVTGHGTLALDSAEDQRKYRELIRTSTCFVMPSVYEPFGVAYLDAGASGLPSIGTTVGGACDAIGDGGLVIDPSDEAALRETMLRMADPETARRLGRRAFDRTELFTWQAVAERALRALRPTGVDVDGLAEFLSPATGSSAGA